MRFQNAGIGLCLAMQCATLLRVKYLNLNVLKHVFELVIPGDVRDNTLLVAPVNYAGKKLSAFIPTLNKFSHSCGRCYNELNDSNRGIINEPI